MNKEEIFVPLRLAEDYFQANDEWKRLVLEYWTNATPVGRWATIMKVEDLFDRYGLCIVRGEPNNVATVALNYSVGNWEVRQVVEKIDRARSLADACRFVVKYYADREQSRATTRLNNLSYV